MQLTKSNLNTLLGSGSATKKISCFVFWLVSLTKACRNKTNMKISIHTHKKMDLLLSSIYFRNLIELYLMRGEQFSRWFTFQWKLHHHFLMVVSFNCTRNGCGILHTGTIKHKCLQQGANWPYSYRGSMLGSGSWNLGLPWWVLADIWIFQTGQTRNDYEQKCGLL